MSKPVENVSAATTDPINPAAPAGTAGGDYILRDAAELDEKFGAVPEHVRARHMNRLDQHCRRFIALSPFMVLGTGDGAAGADVSPRGDAPGFVQIPDDRTLAIPDRPGNNRLDSMRNILRHPAVGLLFLIPGVEESLRINGSALLSRDPARLAAMAISGRQPTVFIQVAIREVYLHCGKALRRSRLWTGEYQIERGALPSLGQMTADQIGAGAAERALIETKIADNYANRLY
jgi:PPOX class probable FMN-dependent enzyme